MCTWGAPGVPYRELARNNRAVELQLVLKKARDAAEAPAAADGDAQGADEQPADEPAFS